jgi:hypothetical protein
VNRLAADDDELILASKITRSTQLMYSTSRFFKDVLNYVFGKQAT